MPLLRIPNAMLVLMKDDNRLGILLDFNTAALCDTCKPHVDDKDRFERIRAEADANALSILCHLLPEGRLDGSEYVCGNVNGLQGKSLKFNIKKGVWNDFAGNADEKGDIISLWMQARSCKFSLAISQIEEYLNLKTTPTPNFTKTPKPHRDLGKPTTTYYYHNETGTITATVTRYDPPPTQDEPKPRKEFIPWDCETRKHTHPNPRPLYNLPGIVNEKQVVLTEGEKCADALIAIGIPATTAMGGSKAPTGKTSWLPLQNKDVFIWPDNDEPGKLYAENVARAIHAVGGTVKILTVPEGKPLKWDAADAVAEGFDVKKYLQNACQSEPKKYAITLSEWDLNSYGGKPPDREWLVDHIFPLKAASNLAAMGGGGKGLLLLHLALQVVCEFKPDLLNEYPKAFGNNVMQRGTAVIFSAEDDRDELHRRVADIDEANRRLEVKDKLILVPLSSTGGPRPIIVPGRNGPETTDFYHQIREQLLKIPDLKLVVFDPLVNFAAVDTNKDTAAVSFVNGVMSSLASDTGAAVIVAHHLNKLGKEAIHTPEQAREKVKGVTTIIDGVRATYCLWSMEREKAKRVCRKLSVEFKPNKVFSGAIVKANGPADYEMKTYLRQNNGLLMVVDDALRNTKTTKAELYEAMVDDVRRGALGGRPFTSTGAPGFFERREELSFEIQDQSKHQLDTMSKDLLDSGKIVKCIAAGSKIPKWLDVPDGPFTTGAGKFEPGFVNIANS